MIAKEESEKDNCVHISHFSSIISPPEKNGGVINNYLAKFLN